MENLIIFIALALFLYFLIAGQHISTLLFGIGILGIFLLEGSSVVTGFIQNDPFSRTASYALTTVPLYILMAQFIMQSGIVKDLYSLMYKLSNGRGGVLGIATILLGGMLGGVSGSGTATSAALGQIAVPELQQRGYPSHLAGMIAASAGSLSAIIPPSVFLIIYGVVAQISIGQLFTAALIPGILLMVVFSLVAMIYLRRSKHEFNSTTQASEMEEVPIYRYIIVIISGLFIFTAIFGGIYMGIFTPTEAGAVGAFLALIMAGLLGKLNFRFLNNALVETTKISVMAMFIVMGASLFGRFISLSLMPRKIIGLLEPLLSNPALVIIIIMVFYFFLFMFIEGAAVILMTVPIIKPLLDTIQVDPLWFGIMLTVVCTIGLITPPVGMSVIAVGGITKIPIERLFKTGIVFGLIAAVVVIGLLIIFPELVTWLPSQMR
ncbi:TRAP transporter large permease [Oceanobacillus saliphilus]|uniref:TRAP transporter large permease n=1 Tax=Oceanobacillus saliphilus TaxID=2925834 RepID=UPI00201D3F66|nr:TRAP transporter large permease [Oceanobacillus saliphilus]